MASPQFLRAVVSAAGVVLAVALASPSAALAQQKIGFVNPQRVVDETRVGWMAKADLARYVAGKKAMARARAAEIAVLRREAGAPRLSAAERSRREEALRRKSAEYARLLQENDRDIKSEEVRLVRYVMRRADAVLQDIGKKGGYAVIITDPNAVGYVDEKAADLTDRLARELNARSR